MDIANIVSLIKARLGITSTIRDTYITAIANAVVKELEDEKGIVLEPDNANHLLFCADYATWMYQNKTTVDTMKYQAGSVGGAIPRYLQYRLHNLMLHNGGDSIDV